MKLKIVFLGAGYYVIPIIEVLKKHCLSLVITTEKNGALIDHLKKEKIPFMISNLKNEKDGKKLEEIKPDIGVLASYGSILSDLVIRNFKLGILNIHPSLLPKYRGSSPVQETILSGEKKTGVSIIRLTEKIDEGPIILQKEYLLSGNETTKDLKERLFLFGSIIIDEILDKLEKGEKLNGKQQKENRFPVTKKITRETGYIDINNPPNPEKLQKMIRAYYPWPGVWTEFPLYGKKRRIKFLPEKKLQAEGKKVMTYQEFINGYKEEGKKLLEKLSIIS